MSPAPRVLIADDHAPTRIGLRAVLEEHGFTVCAEAADAPGAVEAALRERPDICLLDVRMPDDGIAAAAEITSAMPETPVVMLANARDEGDFLNALRAGACGYVLKEADPARLTEALRGALNGACAFPRSLVQGLLERLEQRDREGALEPQLRVLTNREREVLELLREGLGTAEIAKRLFVEPVTVRSHIASSLRKLGVRDRKSALELLGAPPISSAA